MTALNPTRAEAPGLERSCAAGPGGWCRSFTLGEGVEFLSARFRGRAFDKHRHDTYAIGLTDSGVQQFDYRGQTMSSLPGQVVVLHPDEAHDGRAGDGKGFAYRIVYVCPSRIANAVFALVGRRRPLPFLEAAIIRSDTIAKALDDLVPEGQDDLACDALSVTLAGVLLEQERGGLLDTRHRLDEPAVERARDFLGATLHRPVLSSELEQLTGLDRYELSRQFRVLNGTSPYRYALLRRLDAARRALGEPASIADVAARYGFSDQAHFTRHFHRAFGLTPARCRRLQSAGYE